MSNDMTAISGLGRRQFPGCFLVVAQGVKMQTS